METALLAFLVSAGTGTAVALIQYWLGRNGRQLAGRSDIRADLDMALKQIAELRQEVKDERALRIQLQAELSVERELRIKLQNELNIEREANRSLRLGLEAATRAAQAAAETHRHDKE
jgi:hypothetical protein